MTPMAWQRIRHRYTPDRRAISARIRFGRAGGRREWCGAARLRPHPATGSKAILIVAHLDHGTEDHGDGNLAALCQRCHLGHDRAANAAKRRRAGGPGGDDGPGAA